MNTESIVVSVIEGLVVAGLKIYEGVTGEPMTEEEFRAEMLRLLAKPPKKAALDWDIDADDVP